MNTGNVQQETVSSWTSNLEMADGLVANDLQLGFDKQQVENLEKFISDIAGGVA